ncbi:MAG TPA: site-specific integrase, partial [Acidobacteriaceae bacterium]|nr:site-specific integrase [Acidobacteriaceae bacterium]
MSTPHPIVQPASSPEIKQDDSSSVDIQASPLGELVSSYLAMLANERASSPHTLRAYERELHNFVAYIFKTQGQGVSAGAIEHLHIRAWLGSLYDR